MNITKNWLLIGAIASSFGLAACQQSPPPQANLPPPATPNAEIPPPQQLPAPLDAAPAPASIVERAEQRAALPATPATPASPALPAARYSEPEPAYAQVISVKPVRDERSQSRQRCRDVEVARRAPIKDENKVAGTAIGAVLGGVVGNQVGGGRGRDLATVAGAVGGGLAGRKIQENQQDRRTVTTVEQRCETVKEDVGSGDIIAYDIIYDYAGQTHKARLDYDPGDRVALPVRSID